MKDEELWNKILLVAEVGDWVRFKHGKVTWAVYATGTCRGKHYIKLRRRLDHEPYLLYKEVYQTTQEYRQMRIVKTHR